MKRMIFLVAMVTIFGWLLAACGAPPSPVDSAGTPKAGPAAPAGGQSKWDKVLADARKEGEVLIYSNINPALRTALSDAFRQKYGVQLNFLSLARGSEVYSRTAAEKRAGINAADFFITGSTTLVVQMKGDNLLGPIEPLLILPEALDKKAWTGGELPFTDQDKKSFDIIGAIWGAYVRNTDMIKEGEITGFRDILNPTYKGKMVMTDPSTPGSSNAFMTHLAKNLYDQEKAIEFLKELMKLDTVVTRDMRQQAEWLARGKYALAIGPDSKETAAFIEVGAPLALIWPKEGAYTSSVGGSFGVPVQSPHPNATTVFVNWLLTREGQTVFSQGFGLPSNRTDVPNLTHPKLLPPKDLKIYRANEDYIKLQGRMISTSQEVMASSRK